MHNLKLGAKIALGFGALIVIALLLGSMAVYNMSHVETAAKSLAQEYVPEVAIANEVERASLLTMYEIRGYGLTGDEGYLKAGNAHLADVNKHLKAAADHAQKYTALVKLKDNAARAQTKVKEYEQLVTQTSTLEHRLDKLRQDMAKDAEAFLKNGNDFGDDQQKKLKEEVKSGAAPEKIIERAHKVDLLNDVTELGNVIRVENWKAQATRDPKLLQSSMKGFAEINKKLDELRAVTNQEVNLKQIAAIKDAATAYSKAMEEFLSTWLALQEVGKKRGDVGNEVLAAAQTTAKAGMDHTMELSQESASSLSRSSFIMLLGLGVALILGCLLAFFITKSITGPIQRVIAGLTDGSQQVASAANQVARSSQSLAEGASQQAAALEETSSSLEEMSSMTKTNADNAAQANNLMSDSKALVDRANQSMGELTQSMEQISQAGEETGKIIKTIDEIAFQTNLLALNAAVEAARAGEAGAGFAVVAEEVRNLAMRAAEAAKNTAGLIEGTIKKTKEGSELVARTNEAFQEVAASSEKVAELVGEISAASSEQAQGIEQVNKAASEMDKVTQQNAANAEESASASEELSSQAETMQGFVQDLANLAGTNNGQSQQSRLRMPALRRSQRIEPMEPRALPAPATRKRPAAAHHPAPAAKTAAEKAIPLDDDFKDF